MQLSIGDTLRALLIAPLGATATLLTFGAAIHLPLTLLAVVITTAWVWAISVAAGFVFVLPVFVIVPRYRLPPLWLAVLWGAAVAVTTAALLLGRTVIKGASTGSIVEVAAAGAAAGMVYLAAARRTHR